MQLKVSGGDRRAVHSTLQRDGRQGAHRAGAARQAERPRDRRRQARRERRRCARDENDRDIARRPRIPDRAPRPHARTEPGIIYDVVDGDPVLHASGNMEAMSSAGSDALSGGVVCEPMRGTPSLRIGRANRFGGAEPGRDRGGDGLRGRRRPRRSDDQPHARRCGGVHGARDAARVARRPRRWRRGSALPASALSGGWASPNQVSTVDCRVHRSWRALVPTERRSTPRDPGAAAGWYRSRCSTGGRNDFVARGRRTDALRTVDSARLEHRARRSAPLGPACSSPAGPSCPSPRS